MKRRSVRAPLAPLHSNSLHADSPRCQEDLAKRETKKGLTKLDPKAQAKADAAIKGSTVLQHTFRPSQKPSRPAAGKSARASSPAKARRSAPLVTTNAQSQAGAPAGKVTAPHSANTSRSSTSVSARSGKAAAHSTAIRAPAVTAVPAAPLNASPDALSHWHIPGSQPHLDAVLTPLDTPAASRRDTMYFPPHQVTPASTVQGAGTPQDFSDVFDLESVSGQTPGGCATFAGRRDKTPGLILDSLPSTSQQDQEQSLHTWLAASPGHPSRQYKASPPSAPSPAECNPNSASKPALGTPAAAQVLKELRIKTPQQGRGGASSLLRSSPFLAQLLRTAPSLSPAPSLALASPSSASKVVLRLPSPRSSPGSLAVSSPAASSTSRLALKVPSPRGSPTSVTLSSPRLASADSAVSTSSMESAGSNTLEETASGTLQVLFSVSHLGCRASQKGNKFTMLPRHDCQK